MADIPRFKDETLAPYLGILNHLANFFAIVSNGTIRVHGRYYASCQK